MHKLSIEICVHCFLYQRRLNWMLSSILQQKGDVPDILFNISYIPDNGNPKTEDVIAFFRNKGLNIKETVISDNDKANRSRVRQLQLKESKADFIIFADADMVYSPFFFSDLSSKLTTTHKDEPLCMGADRHSLSIPFCDNYFKNEDKTDYPCNIKNVAEIVSKWPIMRIGGKGIAAGYFQAANVKLIRDRNLEYPIKRRDGLRTYKGDRAWRCVLGGRCPLETLPQYHLNHNRTVDGEQR